MKKFRYFLFFLLIFLIFLVVFIYKLNLFNPYKVKYLPLLYLDIDSNYFIPFYKQFSYIPSQKDKLALILLNNYSIEKLDKDKFFACIPYRFNVVKVISNGKSVKIYLSEYSYKYLSSNREYDETAFITALRYSLYFVYKKRLKLLIYYSEGLLQTLRHQDLEDIYLEPFINYRYITSGKPIFILYFLKNSNYLFPIYYYVNENEPKSKIIDFIIYKLKKNSKYFKSILDANILDVKIKNKKVFIKIDKNLSTIYKDKYIKFILAGLMEIFTQIENVNEIVLFYDNNNNWYLKRKDLFKYLNTF